MSKTSYFLNPRIHLFLFAASLLLIIVPVINKTPSTQITEKTLVAAVDFLYLVDTEEYAKSWDTTAIALKDMLPQSDWNAQIAELRSALGPVVERRTQNLAYTDSADDVPAGQYVVMTFVSKFEFRERVVETLTLMLDQDNLWRVAGYFIR
ncbi:MAG: DUF4019 domain-containing protein [Desulfuromonadales bacterium]|nr:DUF4019 domain-containing protein [Desulfuromonadales bacterium]